MAQPGRTMARPDRARRHRTRRLHCGARSQKKPHAIHPPVQQGAQTREVEILRHVTKNYYRINRYSPLVGASRPGMAAQPLKCAPNWKQLKEARAAVGKQNC